MYGSSYTVWFGTQLRSKGWYACAFRICVRNSEKRVLWWLRLLNFFEYRSTTVVLFQRKVLFSVISLDGLYLYKVYELHVVRLSFNLYLISSICMYGW